MNNYEFVIRQTCKACCLTTFNLKRTLLGNRAILRSVTAIVSLFVLGSATFGQSNLTPVSLSFGSIPVGETSKSINATFKNTQKTPMTISSIGISGSASADYAWGGSCPISPKTLVAGASCTIPVTFTPSALGNLIATLTVTSSSSLSPQSVALAGIGIAPVTVAPASLVFPSTVLGMTSTSKTVTLTNHLNVALNMSAVSTSGNFTVVSNSCGSSVLAGKTCIVGVTFTPSALGVASGALTLNYLAFGSPSTVALSGTGADTGLTSITVTPSSSSIADGNTQQFTATGHFKGGTTENLNSFVTWSSSKTTVATISAGGLATGVTQGTTSIGAALGSVTGSTTLTVTAPVLVSIAVTPASPSITKGATQQFIATGTYSNATTQNLTSSVTWASANPAVATITAGGLATGLSTGMSSITATLGGVVSPTDTLTVTAPVLVSIAVTPTNASIAIGATQQFTATGTFSDTSTQNLTSSVTWSSSNPSAATITASGLATGVGAGMSNITATLSSVVSPAVILTVAPPTLESIAVTPANPSIALGTSLTLKATGIYSDGSTQDLTAQVSWSSSSSAVTVSNAAGSQGSVMGANQGSSTVSAASTTTPVVTGSTTVTVTAAALVSIAVNPASPTVVAGLQQQFTAVGTYTTGITQDITASVSWSSSNQAIATISNAAGTQGEATTLSQGSTTITAAMGSINGSSTLTVGPAALVSISVNPADPSIALGTSQQFTALGSYSDSTTQDITTAVTWSASPGGLVIISNTTGSNGLATSTGEGVATITATFGSVSGNAQLTVTSAVLTSIAVNPTSVSIYQGASQQFTAMGTYSDSTTQDVTASVAWSAGTGAVATVSNSIPQGLVTAVAGGMVQIVATYTPPSGSSISSANTGGGGNLTVVALNSIAIQPVNPAIALGTGAPEQFTAAATFADGTNSNVTTSATWASSNPGVAPISNTQGAQGQASAVSTGTTTISATYASAMASTVLTVLPSAPLESITVAPSGVSLGLFGTQQFTATGNYSDGTTADLTQIATWSSYVPQTVTISSTGLATVIDANNTAVAISASYGSIAPFGGDGNTAWVSALSGLAPNCPTPTIDLRLLVLNNAAANYADFPAIQQILNYVGTPYDVVDVVTGTLPPLSDGACHAYYQGVIYAFGDDIYVNPAMYQALTLFEQTFKVRQLNWNTNPTPDFGFNFFQNVIPDSGTDSGSFTPSASPVFFYANTSTPVTIENAYIYLTTPTTPPEGGTVTPLLVDPSGYTLSGITTFSDGRQYLSQMFDSNQYLTHDLILAYGLLNWVTQGVFLGDYHVYASPQVDDFFIDDTEWIPGTSCLDPVTHDRTAPDASNLPVFRVNSNDMAQLATWQNGIQNDPSGLFSKFKLTLAFNGVGTAGNGDWTGLVAPITATSATDGVVTFTTSDFSGQPGAQVTVAGTTNDNGGFNGTWTVLSVSSITTTTPATTQFTASVNGVGNVALQAETGATATVADDLTANLQSYQSAFHWISHTFDHPNTLNNLSKSTPNGGGDDIDLEVLTNLWVASSPNGVNLDKDPSDEGMVQQMFSDFNPANMVTPGVTGLNDPNVPGYLSADGIQYVVTDTSIIGQPNDGPNPSPNVGIVNSYEPAIYEVPRHPNDIYYNVANWNDDQAEFDCIYSYPNEVPPYNSYTAAQILDFVSQSFLSNMLIGDQDPEMFHQPDLHFSINTAPGMPSTGQTTSLIADTYNQTFSLYKQVYNLPVLSPTLDQLGQAMQNRNAFNLSNVTASIIGAYGPNATISVTVPSSSAVPVATIPVTGLNSNGAEVYGGQYISYISITSGNTVTLPLP